MPERLHAQLEQRADKKGLHGTRKDAYVYGTLNRVDKHKAEKGDSTVQRGTKDNPVTYYRCKHCGKPVGHIGGEWRHFK